MTLPALPTDARPRRALLSLLAAAALTLAAMGLLLMRPAPAAAQPPAVLVHISNFTFNAPSVTVAPGTTVTWVNDDDIPHTVVATDRSFKSKPLDTDDRFSFTFNTAGQFDYFCSLHPHMTGKVIVRAP